MYIICALETTLDRMVAALSEIQSLHSLQHGRLNLGSSGSLGIRKKHTARRERKQKIRLEFSWPAEGFRNYPFAFFQCSGLGAFLLCGGFFFPFSIFFLWFPNGKNVISLQVITVIEKEKYFCFFLKMCRDIMSNWFSLPFTTTVMIDRHFSFAPVAVKA